MTDDRLGDAVGEAYVEGRRDERDRIGRELEPTIRFLTAIGPDLDYELAQQILRHAGRLKALRGDK